MKTLKIFSAVGKDTFSEDQINKICSVSEAEFIKCSSEITEAEFISLASGSDIIAVTRKTCPQISEEVFKNIQSKAIAIYATGYEWVDIKAARKYNVKVSFLPDYSYKTVAEQTLGQLLTISRRLHICYDYSENRIGSEISRRGFEISGKKIGIIGMGKIGKCFSKLISPFSDDIVYYDTKGQINKNLKYVEKKELLRSSDIIVLLCSCSRNNPVIISDKQIDMMKNGVVIINSARKALVDPFSIIKGIKSRKVYGYAVDDVVEEFKDADIEYGRIFQTAHSGWYSNEALLRGTEQWVKNIIGHCVDRPINIITEDTL